jgi:hypothetical protein
MLTIVHVQFTNRLNDATAGNLIDSREVLQTSCIITYDA